MSTIWSWFGSSTQKQKGNPKQPILRLRAQLELLQKRERHLQSQIDEQHEIAKKSLGTDKAGRSNLFRMAKKALERKKAHQRSREQTEGLITTLEHQVQAIESANINRETLAVLEQATGAMKQIHGQLTADKVEETMDKLQDQNHLGEEIAQAMASTHTRTDQLDDAELEAELEGLQQEQVDEQMLNFASVLVPNTTPDSVMKTHATVDAEDRELEQLQAEMAM